MSSDIVSNLGAGLTLEGYHPSTWGRGTDIYQIPAGFIFWDTKPGSSTNHLDWPSSSYAVKKFRVNAKHAEQTDRINKMLMILSDLNPGANQAYIHSNICPMDVIDMRVTCDRLPAKILVTPWCSSGNILECINKKPTSTTRKLTWVMQIGKALNHIHSHNLVHGNVCPENILIADNDQAVITDVGVYILTTQILFHPTGRLPTPPSALYKPSEELYPLGDDIIQPSKFQDIYAFASTVYAIFAECPPFSRFCRIEKAIRHIVRHGHQSLKKPEDVPATLWEVLQLCWETDPGMRPHMSEVVGKLQALGL